MAPKLTTIERDERRIRSLARKVATYSARAKRAEEARKALAAELLPLIGDRTIAVDIRGIAYAVSASIAWAHPLMANVDEPKRRKHFISVKAAGER